MHWIKLAPFWHREMSQLQQSNLRHDTGDDRLLRTKDRPCCACGFGGFHFFHPSTTKLASAIEHRISNRSEMRINPLEIAQHVKMDRTGRNAFGDDRRSDDRCGSLFLQALAIAILFCGQGAVSRYQVACVTKTFKDKCSVSTMRVCIVRNSVMPCFEKCTWI